MKKNQSSKRDQYTVVLEDLLSQFKVFGEGLTAVWREVKSHSLRFEKIESDLEIIKGELAIIRHNQVTRDEFKLLEVRVRKLEKLASHR